MENTGISEDLGLIIHKIDVRWQKEYLLTTKENIMDNYFIEVNPVIIYPPCLKSGKVQNCFNCELSKKGGCGSPRAMCVLPYKNHKKGCPNYGKKPDCPPVVPMFDEVFDITKPVYAIFSTYDLYAHTEKMKKNHPQWTEAQLLNVLYWQGTAKKHLKENIQHFNEQFKEKGYYSTVSPEAMGVNVMQTLKKAGIDLEWPARNTAYKIAFAGIPINDLHLDILR